MNRLFRITAIVGAMQAVSPAVVRAGVPEKTPQTAIVAQPSASAQTPSTDAAPSAPSPEVSAAAAELHAPPTAEAQPSPGVEPHAPPAAEPKSPNVPELNTESVAPADPRIREATQRYDRGLKLYAEGEYELAAIEFEKAYTLVPHYRALFNIGQVRIQLGDYALAFRALTQYLERGGQRIPQERRLAVNADIEMLRSRIGSLLVQVSVPDAEISVDDVVVGRSPLSTRIWVDAGRHRIRVTKRGYYPQTQQMTLAGREERRVNLQLLEIPKERSRVIVQQVKESNGELWKWAAWSTTGVLAVAWGVTGGLGVAAANDLEKKRSQLGATRSELDSASRRASTLLISADIVGGLCLVSAGVATYLTLWESEEDKERPDTRASASSLRFVAYPTGVQVSGSF